MEYYRNNRIYKEKILHPVGMKLHRLEEQTSMMKAVLDAQPSISSETRGTNSLFEINACSKAKR